MKGQAKSYYGSLYGSLTSDSNFLVLSQQDGKAIASPGVDGAGAIKVYGQKPSTRDPVDAFRSFRISQDDPCYKVLPAALKKYKINDDWRQYALFICYGNTGR